MGPLTRDRPKAMVEVAGRPFVDHQLWLLRSHGAARVVICVGYRGEAIADYVGDGSRYGLEVVYSHDGQELAGTAGAIRGALPFLGDEFMVLYGDTYLRIDFADVAAAFRHSALPALMTVLHNRGRWGTSNAIYQDGRVVAYDKREPPAGAEWIDYGLSVLRSIVVDRSSAADLPDVLADLAASGLLGGYVASKRFYEIGTPGAIRETEEFMSRQRA